MSKFVYNFSVAAGMLMVGAGVAMISVPWALIISGGLVLVLTMLGLMFGRAA